MGLKRRKKDTEIQAQQKIVNIELIDSTKYVIRNTSKRVLENNNIKKKDKERLTQFDSFSQPKIKKQTKRKTKYEQSFIE